MRYERLDNLRGITFISMFLYHGIWDLVYLYGVNMNWYESAAAYVWQQSICWTFILLSGFCWSLGKRKLRSGLLVLGGGVLVTAVTAVVMPDNPAMFGVLTFLGSAMLLWIWPEKILGKIPPAAGAAISFLLFCVFREINVGWIGFEGLRLVQIPAGFYRNLFTAYLGFPFQDFVSSDYFSLFPWFFLFVTGYYLYRLTEQCHRTRICRGRNIPVIAYVGRHTLLLYLLHQPVLFGVLTAVFSLKN